MELQDLKKLPNHLGIIIDGNGRWAKRRGMPRSFGHAKGFNNLEKILKECFYNYNIPIVSIYAFSTENWNRPKDEVDYLMELFRKNLNKSFEKKYPNVKFNIMGDLDGLPMDIAKNCKSLMENTKDRTGSILNLAVNYSGQDELVYACNSIIKEKIEVVDRDIIANHLYTKGQPPLDFCIRTSGEQRLSNFMLWQLAYTELYFTKVDWPAFSKKDLFKALLDYQQRDRRFGAIKA